MKSSTHSLLPQLHFLQATSMSAPQGSSAAGRQVGTGSFLLSVTQHSPSCPHAAAEPLTITACLQPTLRLTSQG